MSNFTNVSNLLVTTVGRKADALISYTVTWCIACKYVSSLRPA